MKQMGILICALGIFTLSAPAFAECEGNSNGEYVQDLLETVARAMVDSNMSAKAKINYCLSPDRFGKSYLTLNEGGRTCRISLVNMTIYRNSCIKSERAEIRECFRSGGICYNDVQCCSGYCSSVMPGVSGYCH